MVDTNLYWFGVLMAIASGMLNNLGTVVQKKVVNDHRDDKQFLRTLFKNPMWLVGLLLQLAAGSTLFIIAQLFVGPALIPGLMALGLIVLALGAVRIAKETLGKKEKIGIGLMIVAIAFLGFSNLSIDLTQIDFLEIGFLARTTIFSVVLALVSVLFLILAKRRKSYRGTLLALVSGDMIALSNFWISLLIGTITQVFEGNANPIQWVLFIISSAILVFTNLYSLTVLQEGFKSGQASNLIPIQQVPIQLAPTFVYFVVFLLMPLDLISPAWMVVGVGLIIVSSFLLGEQQAKMEAIK
jgi:drug/metabolite transporter (DMT)-like permease